MLNVRLNSPRLKTRFHSNQVTQLLPEAMVEMYPNLVSFLETYYEYAGESNPGSFEHQIKTLFDIRDITSTNLETLDLILSEVGEGLKTNSFAQNPRLMVKLISDFYRAKGTQISVEQFFKSFFAEDVEISYPKNNVFILNDSKIGTESLKYITDNRRYQIFSVNIKTGLSFSDYEALYRKFVHPAGFYLSADVVTQSEASMGVSVGETIDPLEINYPLPLENTVLSKVSSNWTLTVLTETDLTDTGLNISSIPLLSDYSSETFESLIAQGYLTIYDLADLNTPATIDETNANLPTFDQDIYL
jgi:hypothetical protein